MDYDITYNEASKGKKDNYYQTFEVSKYIYPTKDYKPKISFQVKTNDSN